jgi:hypothetical protein
MTPELNWCGWPIGPGESYGGKPEHISETGDQKPALAAAKHHQHYAVITEEDLAEVFGHGAYKLPRPEAAKRLELLTGAHRTSCYRALRLAGQSRQFAATLIRVPRMGVRLPISTCNAE